MHEYGCHYRAHLMMKNDKDFTWDYGVKPVDFAALVGLLR
jgi:hypothetical protein